MIPVIPGPYICFTPPALIIHQPQSLSSSQLIIIVSLLIIPDYRHRNPSSIHHHPLYSVIIRHHPSPSLAIRHHPSLSSTIIRHLPSAIIRRHPSSSAIIHPSLSSLSVLRSLLFSPSPSYILAVARWRSFVFLRRGPCMRMQR